MARDTICPDCGRKFDRDLAERIYDDKYAPKYLYDCLEDNFCLPCAFHYTEIGVVDPANSLSDEREPDIDRGFGYWR